MPNNLISVVLYSPPMVGDVAATAGTDVYITPITPLFETYYSEYSEYSAMVQWLLPLIHYEPNLDVVVQQIIDAKPTVLGIGRYVWNANATDYVADRVKQYCPETIVVSGGPHQETTYSKNPFVHRNNVDAMLEPGTYGEVFMLDLLNQLVEQKSVNWNKVRGAIYQKNGIALKSSATFNVREFEWTTRNPYETHKLYFKQVAELFVHKFIPYETSRGCPYKCSFCEWGVNAFQKINNKPVETVVAELISIADTINNIYITDANFGQSLRDLDILRELHNACAEKKIHIFLRFAGFAKNKKDHLVFLYQLLAESPWLHWSETKLDIIAIQDFVDEVKVANSRTDLSLEQIISFRSNLKQLGYTPSAQLIVGLFGQSIDTHRQNIKILLEHFSDSPGILFSPLSLLPDTPAADPYLLVQHNATVRTIRYLRVEVLSIVSTNTYSFSDFVDMILSYKLINALFSKGVTSLTFESFDVLYRIFKKRALPTIEKVQQVFVNSPTDVIDLNFTDLMPLMSKMTDAVKKYKK